MILVAGDFEVFVALSQGIKWYFDLRRISTLFQHLKEKVFYQL